MRHLLKYIVFICSLFILQNEVLAQDPHNDLTQNRPAIRRLTADGLKALVDNNPVELEKMKYLFTRSFEVELLGCPTCEIDYVDLFNISLFDVTEYSNQRSRTEVHEFDFKNKYHITLHAEKDMLIKYTSIEKSFSTEKHSSELPKFYLKGDVASSYDEYRTELDNFKMTNLELYEANMENNNVLKIKADEFLSFSEGKRETVLNHPAGYLIIE